MHRILKTFGYGNIRPRRATIGDREYITDGVIIVNITLLGKVMPKFVRDARDTMDDISRVDNVGAIDKMLRRHYEGDTSPAEAGEPAPMRDGTMAYPITDGQGLLAHIDARYHEPLTSAGLIPRIHHPRFQGFEDCHAVVYCSPGSTHPEALVAPMKKGQ